MKTITFLFIQLLVLLTFSLQAGNPSWKQTRPGDAVFRENRAQLDGLSRDIRSRILFGYTEGPIRALFTQDGMSWRIDKFKPKREWGAEREANEKLEKQTGNVRIEWVNRSPASLLIAEDVTSDEETALISSEHEVAHIKGYKRLVYKNLYPHIDLVYTIHPERGIKYAFLVHPGGDVNAIAMRIQSDRPWTLNTDGELVFKTPLGAIVDHAPSSYLESEQGHFIASRFERSGDVVRFHIDNYDHSSTLIIDPWTATPALPSSNKIWETETDAAGNVFIYGGEMPMVLKKYSTTGTLQWTYTTAWDTTNFWIGTFIVDPSGNSYITSSANGELRKINPSGSSVWYNNPNGLFGPLFEYWHMAFNCDYTELLIGGMRTPSPFSTSSYRGSIMKINLSNGSISSYLDVGYTTGGFIPTIKEVRSICSGPNGKYYYLTLDSIGALNSGLTVDYQTSSTYNFTYGIPAYGATNQGISAMRANSVYLYTQNGTTLHRRNLSTGAIINSVTIPGGVSSTVPFVGGNTPGNSGLDIDSCGNIYVGSTSGVYKFDAALTQLSFSATSGAVYDVDVTSSGNVIACGNGFVSSVNIAACNPMPAQCFTSMMASEAHTTPTCPGACNASATATPIGGTGPYTYSWSNGQLTQTATGLCDGNYTATVSDANGNSYPVTVTIIDPAPLLSSTFSAPAACGISNGSAWVTASGGTGTLTYNWASAGQTNDTITGLASGSYYVTVSDSNSCSIIDTAVVVNTNAPSIATQNSTGLLCNGDSTGVINTSVTGGTTPYVYAWSPIGGNASSASNLPAGNYTLTITDSAGCTSNQNFTIAAPPVLQLSVTVINTTCGNANGSALALANGGTGPINYQWNTGAIGDSTLSSLAAGIYFINVTDVNGCSIIDSITINTSTPAAGLVSTSDVACNGANTGSANIVPVAGIPPYSFTWSDGSSGAGVTGLQAGSYSVSITDSAGCSSAISFNIEQAAAVSLDAGPTLTVADSVPVQISSTDNAMQPSYAWTPAEGLSCSNCPNPLANPQTTTTYTLTLTDANGCSSTDTVRVIVENKCGNVFVPNAFSPDNDGNNEVLYVYGNCITILEFMIFDRWGEKVFQTNDKTVGWDGKLKGVLMNENVFIYYLHATLKNGEEVTKKGNITLIHE